MRVTGSGITRSGNTSLIVTNVTYPGANATVVRFNQTVGGTVNAATTLTFHSVMHLAGQVTVDNFGTSNQTCTLNAADVVAFNQAPTALNQAGVSATTTVAKEITLTGSDPEEDTLTFTLTKTPGNGTVTYTDANNQTQTITGDGGAVSHVLGSPVISYTASSTGITTITFKVNDGQQDSGTGTITINVTGG